MMTLAKSALVIFLSLSLVNCGEEDGEVDARKATDGASQPDTSGLNIFEGFIVNDSMSDPNCPRNKTAELRLSFTNNTINFELPPSSGDFTNLNNTLIEENGTRNLNQGANTFSVIYSLLDPTNTFDNGACDATGGGYAGTLELNLNGTISGDGTFATAQSTISIRCVTPNEIRTLCAGFFSGETEDF